jgi:hypothetical protein
MSRKTEVFVSVDVETAGPIPGEYSLLSIGACVVDDPAKTFSCELKPINRNADPKAPEVSGLSLDELAKNGLEPAEAMRAFTQWLDALVGKDGSVVFVGLNAPFDWSFVNYYFHRFTGGNPFGFTALDIKALFMGATGCDCDLQDGWQGVERHRQKYLQMPAMQLQRSAGLRFVVFAFALVQPRSGISVMSTSCVFTCGEFTSLPRRLR